MRVAERLLALPGVRRATLVMASPANREILAEAGLLDAAAARAQPSDLLIVIDAQTSELAQAALVQAEQSLTGNIAVGAEAPRGEPAPRSLGMALSRTDGARLAQISVPGPYAAAEALKAIKAGLHVFLFSDNVPIAQERAIKQAAQAKRLLVMGPDCGTAIIGGVPLGFANVVRRGPIGLVAASGTGLQEVTCQIHLHGGGISHAIGTGGRDVTDEIGGLTMLAGIDALRDDPATKVIVVVSKPPGASVAAHVLAKLRSTGKPAVVLFIGSDSGLDSDSETRSSGNIHVARSLLEAATTAVHLAGGAKPALPRGDDNAIAAPPGSAQGYVRALYSGGTYCSETQAIWRDFDLHAWSNVPLDKRYKLADARCSVAHTVVDLGEDEFTVGRPHPMIDLSSRIERMQVEAADPETALLMLDVVLGYGSHVDPAGGLAASIGKARAIARAAGRELPVVTFVCGTELDPQRLETQRATLIAAGAMVAPSSSQAARWAGQFIAAGRRASPAEPQR